MEAKFLWITGKEILGDSHRKRFDNACTLQLEIGKDLVYEEILLDLWNGRNAETASYFFKDWYSRVIHTNLEPLKGVACTIKERLANIESYCSFGIANAVAKGINSKIMAINRRVGGYRNRQNCKTVIYLY